MRRLITRECLIVLLSAMVLCMVPSWAMAVGVPIGGTFMSGGLTYKVLTDTTVEVVGGFAVGDMVIPSTVTSDGTNYLVTSIGDSAFAYSSYLASVTIPTSVTLIGDSAFAHCFQLASVTIPAAVTSIGDHAFAGCYGLTAIDVSAGSASFKSSDGADRNLESKWSCPTRPLASRHPCGDATPEHRDNRGPASPVGLLRESRRGAGEAVRQWRSLDAPQQDRPHRSLYRL